eukprot:3238365-Amphidinium_carterae.1
MGVERDPRHPALLRMFIEHRNRIVEDMVICECQDRLGEPSAHEPNLMMRAYGRLESTKRFMMEGLGLAIA